MDWGHAVFLTHMSQVILLFFAPTRNANQHIVNSSVFLPKVASQQGFLEGECGMEWGHAVFLMCMSKVILLFFALTRNASSHIANSSVFLPKVVSQDTFLEGEGGMKWGHAMFATCMSKVI